MPHNPTNADELIFQAKKAWERGPSTETYMDHNDMYVFKTWKPRSYDIYGTRFTAECFEDLVRQIQEKYPDIAFQHEGDSSDY